MKILEYLIKKRVTVLSFAISTSILFIYFLRKVPIEFYPQISYPELKIAYYYSSGTPEVLVREVTEPVEGILYSTKGVISVRSVTGDGRITFRIKISNKANLSLVKLKIAENLKSLALPDYVIGPLFDESETVGSEFMVLKTGLKNAEKLRDEIQKIPGVRSVFIVGGKKKVTFIKPDFEKIAATGLSPSYIYQTLYNFLSNEGRVGQNLMTQFERNLRDLPIETGIRLGDVATIVDSSIGRYNFYLNGKPACTLVIKKQENASAVSLSRQIRKLTGIKSENVIYDAGEEIRIEIKRLVYSLILGVLLLFISLKIFEGSSLKSFLLLVPGIFALMVSYILFGFLGLSVNYLTLSGLLLGFGMLVDAMLIYSNRVLFSEKSTDTAIIEAGKDIFLPLLASAATTMVIFLPIFYMSDRSRAFFSPFAQAITISLLASIISTYTVGIHLIRIYSKSSHKVKPLKLPQLSPLPGIIATLAIIVASVLIFRSKVRYGLDFGKFREKEIRVVIEYPRDANPFEIIEWNKKFRKFVEGIREEYGYHTFTFEYPGKLVISNVFSKDQIRRGTPYVVREKLEDFFKGLSGFSVTITGFSPEAFVMRPSGEELMTIKVKGYRYSKLIELSEKLASLMRRHWEFVKVKPIYDYRTSHKYYTLKVYPDPEIIYYLAYLHLPEFQNTPVVWAPDPLDVSSLRVRFRAQLMERYSRKTITREDRNYVNMIGFAFIGQASVLETLLEEIKNSVKFPTGYGFADFHGENMKSEFADYLFGMFLSVILIFVTTGIAFNSLRYTFVMILSIPFGFPGVTLIYWLTKAVFDQFSLMGIIIASGIVINDAILLTSYALKIKDSHDPISEAVAHKAKPILITSITTISTAIPFLIFSRSELWFKLSLSLIGMLTTSTILILLLLPSWLKFVTTGKKADFLENV